MGEETFVRPNHGHLASKEHLQAELLQCRLDWCIGCPKLPDDVLAQDQLWWKSSLRGKRKFPPNMPEPGKEMPGAVSKENVALYWGDSFVSFGDKFYMRIMKENTLILSQGNSKPFALPTKFISHCIPAIAEYYRSVKKGGGIHDFFLVLFLFCSQPHTDRPGRAFAPII